MTRKLHVFAGNVLGEKFTQARRAVPEPSSPGRLWDPWPTARLGPSVHQPSLETQPFMSIPEQNPNLLEPTIKSLDIFTEKRMLSFLSLLSSLHFYLIFPPLPRNKGMLLSFCGV